jgi:UDP-N-acetylglucosamine transferase subunit ALG13
LIFVTVGNATQPFTRLLAAVDRLATEGIFAGEPVLIQSGNNPGVVSHSCEVRPFISMDEFVQFMQDASLLICHGGCGTQLHAIRLGRIPVVIPRRAKYGEHINDHQVQLVKALAEQGKIVPAFETDDLPQAILTARRLSEMPIAPQPSPMLSLVAQAIEEFARQL